MKVNNFVGGESIRVRPQYIQSNQAVECFNVDTTVGTLVPTKLLATTPTAAVGKYNVVFNGEWVGKQSKVDFVQYQDKLFYTNRTNQLREWLSATESSVAVIKRPASLTATAIVAPEAGTVQFVSTASASYSAAYASPYDDPLPLGSTQLYLIIHVTPENKHSSVTIYSMPVWTTPQVSELVKQQVIDVYDLPATQTRAITSSAVQHYRSITLATPRTIDGRQLINDNDVLKVYRLYNNLWYQVCVLGNGAVNPAEFEDRVYNLAGLGASQFDIAVLPKLFGTYSYAASYYQHSTGRESALSNLSAELDLSAGGSVRIVVPASTDPYVDKKRIYRIGGNSAVITMVAEVANNAAAYRDNIRDSELTGVLHPQSIGEPAPVQPPNNLRYLTKAYAMMFGVSGSTVRFTPVGNPYSWPAEYYIQFDETVTGIAPTGAGVLVFTKDKTHIITGTGLSEFAVQLVSSDQGCIAFESVQLYGNSALWMSSQGVCTYNAGRVHVLTKDTYGAIIYSSVECSALCDEVYYLQVTPQLMYVIDFRFGTPVFKRMTGTFSSLTTYGADLFMWKAGHVYKMFAGGSSVMRYVSPVFVDGDISERKAYKRVRMLSRGDVTLSIAINDAIVAEKQFTNFDSHVILIPQELQIGFYLQVTITGTGEVLEYDYSVSGRENKHD